MARLPLVAAFLGVLCGLLPYSQALDLWLYDVRQVIVRSLRDQPIHPQLVLVGLDEKSAQAGLTSADLDSFAASLQGSARVLRSEHLVESDPPDRDGVTRRFRLHRQGNLTPLGQCLPGVPSDNQGFCYPLFQLADTQALLLSSGGFHRLAPVPLLEAAELGDRLRGKVVVLGPYLQSAEEVDRKTPSGAMTPLEITGNLLDCGLQGQYWRPLAWPIQVFGTVLWVVFWGRIFSRLPPPQALLALGLQGVLWCLGQGVLAWYGFFASMLPAALGAGAYVVASLTLQWPRMNLLLAQFSTPQAEPIESDMREASILFTLLPAYVLRRESEDHNHASRLRREYARLLGEICAKHDGLILDQQGDAQMVGFGLIHPAQAHALQAVATGLEVCARVAELLQRWGVPEEAIHCGVCTGPVAWGEVGASQLKAAAAIGDTTNTAARLMGAAKKLGKPVLISEPTFVHAGVRICADALEPLHLKGKAEPVPVYQAQSVVLRANPRRPPPPTQRQRTAPRLALVLCLGATWGAWMLGPVPLLSWLLWDLPLIQERPTGPRILIAGIDPDCLQVHPWPWPRHLHAQVLENLDQAGVECVFFDVLFDSPGLGDASLAQAIEKSPRVVLAGAAGHQGGFAEFTPPRLFRPLDENRLLAQNKLGLIHTRLDDQDGRIRSLSTIYRNIAGRAYPSAALAVASKALRQSIREGPPLRLGPKTLPERSMIRWHRPALGGRGWPNYQSLSYSRLVDPDDPVLKTLRGVTVLIGDAMPGDSDRFDTPVGKIKGVEVHAMLASTLAQSKPPDDRRDGLDSVLLAALGSGLLAWFGWRSSGRTGLLLASLGALSGILLVHWMLLRNGWVLGQQAVVAVAITALALLASKALLSVSALRRFVPDAVLAEFLHFGQARDRTGEATILVTDIRGYTSLSERRSPVEILDLLNQYHEETVACYERHGGSVLTYQGDAQLVVFGLLQPLDNGARRAVLAALELQEVVVRLRSRWKLSESETFDVGAGLCTGTLTVGLLRAGSQQQYTVLGESVRRAHKVQSLSDQLGQSVLLDQRTRVLCADEPSLVEVGHDQTGVGPLFAPAVGRSHAGSAA
jgi:adenylate cyclase